MKLLLCVIGLVLIIEGLPYFTFPGRVKVYLARIIETPSPTLRTIGFFSIIIGAVLVYFGRT